MWASSAVIASIVGLLLYIMNLERTNKVPPWPVYCLGMKLLDAMEKLKSKLLPAPVRLLELSSAFWQTQVTKDSLIICISFAYHFDSSVRHCELQQN
jgi:hypothetical protein